MNARQKRIHPPKAFRLVSLLCLLSCRILAVTFTSSIPPSLQKRAFPYGEGFGVAIPLGDFDGSDLPNREYLSVPLTTEYHWSVAGLRSGNGTSVGFPGLDEGENAEDVPAPGVYAVSFTGTGTYHISWFQNWDWHYQGPFTVPLTAKPGGTLSTTVRVVAVASLTCEGVTSTSYAIGDNETLILPVGHGNGTVTITATPTPIGVWPENALSWSGVPSSNGSTATVSTTSPGTHLVTASCGYSSVSLRVIVVEVSSLRVGNVGNEGSTVTFWNDAPNGAYGNQPEYIPGAITPTAASSDRTSSTNGNTGRQSLQFAMGTRKNACVVTVACKSTKHGEKNERTTTMASFPSLAAIGGAFTGLLGGERMRGRASGWLSRADASGVLWPVEGPARKACGGCSRDIRDRILFPAVPRLPIGAREDGEGRQVHHQGRTRFPYGHHGHPAQGV
ncbi:MAG: hypothetical protein IJJ26_05535 [Victivallales bacterium]|nr:hypothetical protein [Victivallales bacterium]